MSTSLLPDDDQLWQMCVSNDQKAFDQMFRRNFHSLCQYASRFNLTTSMVEEVVSDVFINLWLKRGQLQIGQIKPYLYTATRNTALNFIKKNSIQFSNFEELKDDIIDAGYEADGNISFLETEQRVQHLINLLPTQQKEVFKLRRLGGYSIEEISTHLNISSKTVSNHLTQASKFVIENLKKATFLLTILINI